MSFAGKRRKLATQRPSLRTGVRQDWKGKPVSSAAQILGRAKEILETRGINRGSYGNLESSDGPVCSGGALRIAMYEAGLRGDLYDYAVLEGPVYEHFLKASD